MSTPLRLAAAACLLPVVALGADRPHVKLGLWEITRESATSGMPSIPEDALARLPPEARARMEAARGGGGPKTSRACVTEKDLDRLVQNTDERERACTRTTVSQTASSLEQSLSCKDPQHPGIEMHGTIKWRLSSPEAATATIDMASAVGDRQMSHHSQLSAKWLGANCGAVKPAAPPAQ
jgi:hypothetical protein